MKKVLTLLLLVMVLSVALLAFAGCNGDDRPPITTEEPDEDRTEEPDEDRTEEPDEERTEAPTEEIEETSTTPVEDVTDAPVATTYTVTFNLNGGTLQSGELTQVVEEGKAATAPVAVNGHKTLTWDADFSCVTGDMTVNAVWEKVRLSTKEMAKIGQEATVTILVDGEPNGSGFYIDAVGTIVTSFHVIQGAESISVAVGIGSATCPVDKIIAFNPVYDLAIIKIDYDSPNYLQIADKDAEAGEFVAAVGAPLGFLDDTCSFGYVTSSSREFGKIGCLQTDASISGGSSGGPLLNEYGEVVGINFMTYTSGNDTNYAVKISMLENVGEECNYSMLEMTDWYDTETSRSYSPYDTEGNFYYSLINNYDTVTGVKCVECWTLDFEVRHGYNDMMGMYIYKYDTNNYDDYIKYLKSQGFEYVNQIPIEGFYVNTYTNEKDGYIMELWIDQANDILQVRMMMD